MATWGRGRSGEEGGEIAGEERSGGEGDQEKCGSSGNRDRAKRESSLGSCVVASVVDLEGATENSPEQGSKQQSVMMVADQFAGVPLFAGGTFMPSQSTESSISPSKIRTPQTLIPVTVKQIIEAYRSIEDKSAIVVDGVELANMRLVGLVMNRTERATEVSFTLDDGTGRIDIIRWANESTDTAEAALIRNGIYVMVHGHLRGFQGKRHAIAFSVQDESPEIMSVKAYILFPVDLISVENHEVKVVDWATRATCPRGLCGQDWRLRQWCCSRLVLWRPGRSVRAVCACGLCGQRRLARPGCVQLAVGSQKITRRIGLLSAELAKTGEVRTRWKFAESGLRTVPELGRSAWRVPWSSSGGAVGDNRGVRRLEWTGAEVRRVVRDSSVQEVARSAQTDISVRRVPQREQIGAVSAGGRTGAELAEFACMAIKSGWALGTWQFGLVSGLGGATLEDWLSCLVAVVWLYIRGLVDTLGARREIGWLSYQLRR
ncbi:Replication protein A 32 kDa subunit A [Platanthera zijinensis]|uniref:Replication protein A 32 kDa subunit A n=1 Tax=Platanthera zijinensis TaxID=2320716 RepID=A0AAP0GEW1_9ASPA